MEVSENFSETTAPDLATEATWRRLPHRTRKPRRLFGRNVVAEFIVAGGGPEARERLLRSLRTEGHGIHRSRTSAPRQPPQSEFVISLEPYWAA